MDEVDPKLPVSCGVLRAESQWRPASMRPLIACVKLDWAGPVFPILRRASPNLARIRIVPKNIWMNPSVRAVLVNVVGPPSRVRLGTEARPHHPMGLVKFW